MLNDIKLKKSEAEKDHSDRLKIYVYIFSQIDHRTWLPLSLL